MKMRCSAVKQVDEIDARFRATAGGPENVSSDCKSMCSEIPALTALVRGLINDRQELRDLLDAAPRDLSSYAFNKCGDDARIYNGIYDLETEVARLRARVIQLETNAVDAHAQTDQIRLQAARECAEIADRTNASGSGGREIRERFGLEMEKR